MPMPRTVRSVQTLIIPFMLYFSRIMTIATIAPLARDQIQTILVRLSRRKPVPRLTPTTNSHCPDSIERAARP
jgi:hypothetical protein